MPDLFEKQANAVCPQCGEERLRPNDLSIRDLSRQIVKDVSSIDGKLVRSWRILLTRPGQLTAAHIIGERRRYITPLALFFIANAAFVSVQALTGTNILSTPLDAHLYGQDWSALVQSLVGDRLASRSLTLDAYAPVFDRSAQFNAKALIILMALAFSPLPALVFRDRHRPAGAHIVFALHLYAFILVLLSAAVLLAQLDVLIGGLGLRSGVIDKLLSVFNLLACGGYIYLAVPRIYAASGARRWVATFALTCAVALLITFYMT